MPGAVWGSSQESSAGILVDFFHGRNSGPDDGNTLSSTIIRAQVLPLISSDNAGLKSGHQDQDRMSLKKLRIALPNDMWTPLSSHLPVGARDYCETKG